MSNKSKFRYFILGCIPPIFYPVILKAVHSLRLIGLSSSVQSMIFAPAWHTIKKGKGRGIKLFIDTSTGQIGLDMASGKYDDYFFDLLAQLKPEGKTILDIGAHIGFDTLIFAKQVGKKGKVIAFEPNLFNRKRLELNCAQNPELKKRIEIQDVAVSNTIGTADFLMTDTVDGWTSSGSFLDTAHTHMEHKVYERELGFQRIRVPVLTLDAFVQDQHLVPDILKIDVEGAEYLVLQGAKKVLLKHKPIVFMELHSIFSALLVGGILAQLHYEHNLLNEDKDGRCFIVAKPSARKQ